MPSIEAADAPPAAGTHDHRDQRTRQISDASYFLYLQRGNRDGFDVEDWLRAEEQIDNMLNSAAAHGTGS